MSDNPSTRAARALVQGLVDAHVEHVVLCPGSRSAPMAYALHAAEHAGLLSVHVRIDERSAGFTALGIGKGAGLAAVVTTSGTAVANLLPAVWEARHSGVPLLVLSADRPRRLRGTWANQTSPLQAGAFQEAALLSLDVGTGQDAGATGVDPVHALRTAVDRARGHAADGWDGVLGPVHLNVCFDDPLVPDRLGWEPQPAEPVEDTSEVDELVAEAEAELQHAASVRDRTSAGGPDADGSTPVPAADDVPPLGVPDPDAPEDESSETDELVPHPGPPAGRHELLMWSRRRTVVVAGDGPLAGYEALELAAPSAFPLLAEPTCAAAGSVAVPTYRHLLDLPGLGADVERVVVFGRPTLSRQVTRLLSRADVDVVHVAGPAVPGPDREHRRVAGVMGRIASAADLEWLDRWLLAGRRARQAVDVVLDSWGGLSGLHVARAVAADHAGRPGDGPNLFVGASSIVRDLDLVLDHAAGGPLVHASRGLSGIDGSLSTAAGIALGRATPVRALVGDLTFLHDSNALLLGPAEERPPVQVVLVNDGGGAIFGLLEHGEERFADVHERYFATPHDVDVAALCRAHGMPHRRVADEVGLRDALARWDGSSGVVEVTVDRGRSRALARAVADAARAAALLG